MAKILPPPVIRVRSDEAVLTLDQLIHAQKQLAAAINGKLETTKSNVKILRQCSQCGAPLHGERCEYCGTQYN